MKIRLFAVILSVVTLLSASCSKNDADKFIGDYTFKTGGYLSLQLIKSQINDSIEGITPATSEGTTTAITRGTTTPATSAALDVEEATPATPATAEGTTTASTRGTATPATSEGTTTASTRGTTTPATSEGTATAITRGTEGAIFMNATSGTSGTATPTTRGAEDDEPIYAPEDEAEEEAIIENFAIVPETGQMRILDNGDGQVLVTMNILNGGVIVFEAEVDGDEITFGPYQRFVTLSTGNLQQNVSTLVTVSGSARLIGETIIFDLEYEGDVTMPLKEYTILSSSIDQIAKKN